MNYFLSEFSLYFSMYCYQYNTKPFKQTYTKLYTLNKLKFLLLHRETIVSSPQSLISLNGRVFLNNFRPSLFIFFAAFKSL